MRDFLKRISDSWWGWCNLRREYPWRVGQLDRWRFNGRIHYGVVGSRFGRFRSRKSGFQPFFAFEFGLVLLFYGGEGLDDFRVAIFDGVESFSASRDFESEYITNGLELIKVGAYKSMINLNNFYNAT